MKICYFTIYPPAIGIDSFYSYWFAKDLGRIGHNVYVISTCLEFEERLRFNIPEKEKSYLEPENVELFSSIRSSAFGRRKAPLGSAVKLVNLALEVASKGYDFDLIFCSNFFPQGVAGLFTKLLIKKPLIISNRWTNFPGLLENPQLGRLITETLGGADKIEIRERDLGYFQSLGVPLSRISFLEALVDPENFTPEASAFDFSPYSNMDLEGKPVITFIENREPSGQLNILIDAASRIRKEDFFLCILSGDEFESYEEIRQLVSHNGIAERTIFLPFQPPWKFASLMKASTCIVYPGDPIHHVSKRGFVPLSYFTEVLLSQKCTVLSRSLYERSRYFHLVDGKHTILFESGNIEQLSDILRSLIVNPEQSSVIGRNAGELALKENEHKDILNERIIMFNDVCEIFSRQERQ